MREGTPSLTAQRVAAYRAGFDRLQAPHDDPQADERLTEDVSRSQQFDPSELMARYLRGRTAFFDRVVVNSLERGVLQVAAIGAGYDGRSLRYARPGVRWFEVDHPNTQADKRMRLDRLGIDGSDIAFVAVDLADRKTAAALLQAGWDPDAPSLMICEGLSVYLAADALETMLAELRSLATVGTRLAISLPPGGDDARRLSARAEFREAIAAAGEPAGNELTAEDAPGLLTTARWRSVDISPRSQQAGFAVWVPRWEPAEGAARPTASRIGRYLEGLYHRRGRQGLAEHLAASYGIAVADGRELDAGVFRVRRDDGPTWIARVFPAQRPIDAATGDAEILRWLERLGYPAERLASCEPLTSHEDQAVLVTDYVAGAARGGGAGLTRFGELLGRLHTIGPLPPAPPGRAERGTTWVSDGTPGDEIAAMTSLLDAARARVPRDQRSRYEYVRQALADIDDCHGLPEALLHPDFVPANAIASAAGEFTLVDWTGAGLGPRLWSLGFLLWAVGHGRLGAVDSVVAGYREHVALEPEEGRRLAAALRARPIVFKCWAFATGREPLATVADELPALRSRADRIAERALGRFEARSGAS